MSTKQIRAAKRNVKKAQADGHPGPLEDGQVGADRRDPRAALTWRTPTLRVGVLPFPSRPTIVGRLILNCADFVPILRRLPRPPKNSTHNEALCRPNALDGA